MRLSALVLALAVLAGCSERLVDEPLPPVPEAPPSADPGLQTTYVKGPAALSLNGSAQFRVRSFGTSARYEWRVYGEDGVLAVEAPSERVTEMTAIGVGTVDVGVRVYDAGGRLVAEGEKRIETTF